MLMSHFVNAIGAFIKYVRDEMRLSHHYYPGETATVALREATRIRPTFAPDKL